MLTIYSYQSSNPTVMSASPSTPSPSTSQVITADGRTPKTPSQEETAVRLKLRKPKSKKKVVWSANTVDNEHMNKKKSKCCCVFEKPRDFGESSSESDDDCDNCRGHGNKKKQIPIEEHESLKDPDSTEHAGGSKT